MNNFSETLIPSSRRKNFGGVALLETADDMADAAVFQ